MKDTIGSASILPVQRRGPPQPATQRPPALDGWKVPVFPAHAPSEATARAGISLASYPRSPDAPRWRTDTLDSVLTRTWETEACAVGYGTRSPTLQRLASEAAHDDEIRATVALIAFFADFDRTPHEPWQDGAQARDALSAVIELFPYCHAAYTTRGGIRLCFVLSEAVPLHLARPFLRRWYETSAERTEEQLKAIGLALDASTDQWTRHHRLPYTVRGEPTYTEGVLSWPERPDVHGMLFPRQVYAVDISSLTPEAGVSEALRAPDAPDPLPAPPAGWQTWVSPGSVAGPYVRALSAGIPWGPDCGVAVGTRNSTLKRAVNSLAAQLFRGRMPPRAEDIYAILGPSVQNASDGPTMADLWRFCTFSAASEAARRAEQAPASVPQDTESAGAAQAGPPALVVCKGAGYLYQVASQSYAGPYADADLYLAMRDEAAIELPIYKPGTGKPRPLTEIVLQCAQRAEQAEIVYPGVDRGGPWSAETRAVRVNAFALREIVPQYSQEVDAWLTALTEGNSQAVRDAFLAWLGTSAELGTPTAALYLEGPPGVGKGMLAAAVAAQFGGNSAPVSLREALSRFNFGLRYSPVAFLDEGMTLDSAGTAAFRSLVAERQHRIEQKNLPIVSLYGCPRAILAGNNSGLLGLVGTHGARDLAALTSRILHVLVPDSLTDSVKNAQTARWIYEEGGSPGALLRHIAYLRTSPQATAARSQGDRYLVRGVRTAYHTRLITSDPVFGSLLLALVLARKQQQGKGIKYKAAHVEVAPLDLFERWRRILPDDAQRPSLPVLSRALTALGSWGEADDNATARVVRIPIDLIEGMAYDCGIPW